MYDVTNPDGLPPFHCT